MPPLIYEIKNHCMHICFNRPALKNALDVQSFTLFHQALHHAQNCSDVRCVLITGAHNPQSAADRQAFSSGMDLSAMSPENIAHYQQLNEPHPATVCMQTLCTLDKPLIAAVNGIAVGFGFTLLLHCDRVFISTTAALKAPFVDLGLVPEAASSYLLPQLVGYRRAMEIFLEAQWISAEQAFKDGIADHICTPQELLPNAQRLIDTVCSKAPQALQNTKRLLLKNYRNQVLQALQDEGMSFELLVGQEENMRAISAFFAKRATKL